MRWFAMMFLMAATHVIKHQSYLLVFFVVVFFLFRRAITRIQFVDASEKERERERENHHQKKCEKCF